MILVVHNVNHPSLCDPFGPAPVPKLVTACQIAPALVGNAKKVCPKPRRSTGSDASHGDAVDCITHSSQVRTCRWLVISFFRSCDGFI